MPLIRFEFRDYADRPIAPVSITEDTPSSQWEWVGETVPPSSALTMSVMAKDRVGGELIGWGMTEFRSVATGVYEVFLEERLGSNPVWIPTGRATVIGAWEFRVTALARGYWLFSAVFECSHSGIVAQNASTQYGQCGSGFVETAAAGISNVAIVRMVRSFPFTELVQRDWIFAATPPTPTSPAQPNPIPIPRDLQVPIPLSGRTREQIIEVVRRTNELSPSATDSLAQELFPEWAANNYSVNAVRGRYFLANGLRPSLSNMVPRLLDFDPVLIQTDPVREVTPHVPGRLFLFRRIPALTQNTQATIRAGRRGVIAVDTPHKSSKLVAVWVPDSVRHGTAGPPAELGFHIYFHPHPYAAWDSSFREMPWKGADAILTLIDILYQDRRLVFQHKAANKPVALVVPIGYNGLHGDMESQRELLMFLREVTQWLFALPDGITSTTPKQVGRVALSALSAGAASLRNLLEGEVPETDPAFLNHHLREVYDFSGVGGLSPVVRWVHHRPSERVFRSYSESSDTFEMVHGRFPHLPVFEHAGAREVSSVSKRGFKGITASTGSSFWEQAARRFATRAPPPLDAHHLAVGHFLTHALKYSGF